MSADEAFDDDLARARALLARDDLDGFYAGVVREEELDYVLAHRFDDPERVGVRALSLLAHHLQAFADQADVPVGQVAEDAVRLADTMDRGEGDG